MSEPHPLVSVTGNWWRGALDPDAERGGPFLAAIFLVAGLITPAAILVSAAIKLWGKP